MNNFLCKICQKEHPIYTLVEMPQPTIISEITSGKLPLEMEVISKDIFLVNYEDFYIESELSIPIKDFEDSLDFLVWVKVWEDEFLSKLEAQDTERFFTVNGTLDAYLPFYPETFEQSLKIKIDKKQDQKAMVTQITPLNELSVDFEKG
ncbi:MAG: DUF2199 domain-containing protein, partial [Bacteroidota bacterium]